MRRLGQIAFALLLLAIPAAAQRLAIVTEALPVARLGESYSVELQTQGGTRPFRWEVVGGRLPAGMVLDRATGILHGAPNLEGDYIFAVRVTDSSRPAQSATRNFAAKVTRPLAIDWVQPPANNSARLYGSVRVFNRTGLEVDVTVIVVAVNEIGKAFTLGYQKLPMRDGAVTPDITFEQNLPRGTYTVHADAVGESAPKNLIFRARREYPPMRIE